MLFSVRNVRTFSLKDNSLLERVVTWFKTFAAAMNKCESTSLGTIRFRKTSPWSGYKINLLTYSTRLQFALLGAGVRANAGLASVLWWRILAFPRSGVGAEPAGRIARPPGGPAAPVAVDSGCTRRRTFFISFWRIHFFLSVLSRSFFEQLIEYFPPTHPPTYSTS